MSMGTWTSPIQPLTAVLPGFEERPSGLPKLGLRVVVSVPVLPAAATAASTAYKTMLFIAPCDGWYLEDAFVAAAVVPNYDSTVLALDNYDASANAARNPLSGTDANLETLTAKEGAQLTLSATQSTRLMDEGDCLWGTLTTGANEVAAGVGISVTLVLRGPEVNPQ